jgi:single-stranded DNA-binding protein
MNSCVLMAEIVQEPQLRYTPDNQTPIAEMMVEFPGMRDEDPPARLKVVGWGSLAQEIQEKYHVGDRLIIEGRLHMNTFERPEGFKEKRAELTAQKLHLLGAGATLTTTAAPNPTVAPSAATAPPPSASQPTRTTPAQPVKSTAEPAKTPAYSAPSPEVDYDDIPF